MTGLDAIASEEIAELDAQIAQLKELRGITIAEMDKLKAGSLRYIAHKVEIEAIERSICVLQDRRIKWRLALATRKIVSARSRAKSTQCES